MCHPIIYRSSGRCSLESADLVKLPGLWETVGMPKEEQPQTYENGEAQKLVDRIEKKVSAQSKNRSSKNAKIAGRIGTLHTPGESPRGLSPEQSRPADSRADDRGYSHKLRLE